MSEANLDATKSIALFKFKQFQDELYSFFYRFISFQNTLISTVYPLLITELESS
ncbi:hypothetical protein C3B55_00492 [Candidatus Pseudomonas adelgestsugas]|uniref:Uncharacterized protein n=1 Tax=Candidatus Pseudomonas adelgestsugas TaxID=1302376 RepID=A0ABX5R949_9PSED|nr:hypothetical protein C3B55_00492 [Candidatus Pseudomonas adelgestsugas]